MSKQTKADRLIEQITFLEDELAHHQERCKHPNHHLTYVLRGNTGNYDPSDNCYWASYRCGLCRRDWIVEGQKNLRGTRRDEK